MDPPLNDMDDATRLIGDLQEKLASLDSKVTAYRQEMALEFKRYSHHLLKDVPQATSAHVRLAVSDLLPRYPAVGPALQEPASDSDSSLNLGTGTDPAGTSFTSPSRSPSTTKAETDPDPDTRTGAAVRAISPASPASPAPAVASTAASASASAASSSSSSPPSSASPSVSASASASIVDSSSDVGRLAGSASNSRLPTRPAVARSPKSTSTGSLRASPTERDTELQGLFTPSFLPLLHASPSLLRHLHPRSPASAASSRGPTDATPNPPAANMGEVDKEGKSMDSQCHTSAARQTPPRPSPARRATDGSNSTAASEQNEGKERRRSALRRSSTGSKGPFSPRRVRFEFEGVEVLPTSSPESSDASLIQSHSLPSPSPGTAPGKGAADDGDAVSAEAILGPDEDSEPPPKKVSSSQALRALSRTPLDTNTIWTVVNAESPEPGSERDSPRNASPGSSKSSFPESPVNSAPSPRRSKKPLKSPPPEPQDPADDDDDDDDDEDSSDDDFLAMAKPKSFANKRNFTSTSSFPSLSRSPTKLQPSPPAFSGPKPKVSTPAAQSTAPSTTISKPAEEPATSVVHDEDDGGIFDLEGVPAPRSQLPPEPAQDEIEEGEAEDGEEENGQADTPGPESRPSALSTSPAVPIAKPETSAAFQPTYATVGSFKGRPVTMSVVTNPQVYAQAASLGDVNTFVGGLDGSTGADEGDLASYRASVGQALYSGTPRSLTERMLMEDAQAQRRAAVQGRP